MRLKIRGKTWMVKDADIEEYGLCTHAERLIEIRANQGHRDRLDTMIHEVLHALDPDATERFVQAAANTLTTALWGDGWRRTK